MHLSLCFPFSLLEGNPDENRKKGVKIKNRAKEREKKKKKGSP